MSKAKNCIYQIITILILSSIASATDWPQWRGPFLNGSTDEENLPDNFSKTENIAWTAPLPGPSSATPVISNGKVFVSSTDAQSKDLLAICLDEKTGKEIWRKTLSQANKKFNRNNMASPSPVTDGKNVFFFYGSGRLTCLDLDGNIKWSRNLENEYGTLSLLFGYSASPLLFDGKLYVSVLRRNKVEDGKTLDSFLLAMNPETGTNIFKHQRKSDAVKESLEAYSTPTVFKNNGRFEIGIVGGDCITAHDPDTGKEFWRLTFNPEKITIWNTTPVLVKCENVILACIGRGKQILAIKANSGDGLLSKNDLAWTFEGPGPDVCCPAFYKGNIYVLDGKTKKVITCLDPKTGTQKWQGKLGGKSPFRASPTAADDKIYCVSEAGQVIILRANDKEFKIISTIDLNDTPSHASIAAANSRLFIRTATKLLCIGK